MLYWSFYAHWCFNIIFYINTLRPRQNGRYFAEDTFKRIFLNENVWISIKIPLKFVPKGPINDIPALVEIMAWCQPGVKPSSEAMMVRLPTHTCVSRPQWVKSNFQDGWYDLSKSCRTFCQPRWCLAVSADLASHTSNQESAHSAI